MKGLVLEGGGARGAYQIGAYKALKDLGMDFQGISGTSIGALNGAYIVQNDINIMEEVWTRYDYTHFMNIDEQLYEKYKNVDFTPKNINHIIELMNKARKNQGIDITPLKKLLNDTLDENIVRSSKKDFAVLTVSWKKKFNPHPMYIEEIENGRLIDYLIASASLPIFKLCKDKVDDRLYLDGMFSENIPISLLEKKGYTDIVVIRLLDDFLGKMHINKFKELNIKTIVPSEDLGGCLNKDKDHISKNMKLGYLDAMKSYARYDGVNYYFNIDSKFDEDYCFFKIKSMNKEIIKLMCDLLNIKKDPTIRTLLEDIVPKVGDILELPNDFTYKDLFYSVYEKKLQENEINRINLYDFNKVINLINKNINSLKTSRLNLESSKTIYIPKQKLVKALTNNLLLGFID